MHGPRQPQPTFAEDMRRGPVGHEHMVRAARRFGLAHEQQRIVLERVVKARHDLGLQSRPKIYHHVAAAKQVNFLERWVLRHVVFRKQNDAAQRLNDLDPVGVLRDVFVGQILGDIVKHASVIDAASRDFESININIGGENLDVRF